MFQRAKLRVCWMFGTHFTQYLLERKTDTNFGDVCKLLQVCHSAGLIFNSDKFQFGQETVEFAGLEVTMTGVTPSRKFLESIRAFPAPRNLS